MSAAANPAEQAETAGSGRGPRSMHRHLAALAVCGATYFIMGAAIDMLLALLPSVAAAFGVSAVTAVWVTTVRSCGRMSAPLIGMLSERSGRREVVLLGLGVLGLGSLGSSLGSTFAWLVAAQALAGLGLAAIQVGLPAYLGDLFPYNVRGRMMGVAMACGPIGTIVGVPLTAFLAQEVGLQTAFLVLAVIALGLVPIAALVLTPPAHGPGHPGARPKGDVAWSVLLQTPAIRAALVVTFLWMLGLGAFFNFVAAWMAGSFGLSAGETGLVFSLLGGASVLAYAIMVSTSDRIGKRRMALGGLLLGSLATLLVSAATELWMALPAVFLFTLMSDLGFAAYVIFLTELVPSRRGAMLSLHTLAVGVGTSSGPLLGGIIWGIGGFPLLALTFTGLGLVALVVGLCFLRASSTSAPLPA